MTRREFPAKIKAEAALRANGHCENCGCRLMTGHIEYDHVIPAELGGPATLDNCSCVCSSCHSGKTYKQDIPAIAKAKRRERSHLGIRKPRTMTSWRRFDGSVVRVERER
jgi:5-methylcytosine-specific restriction endonuclease McrA